MSATPFSRYRGLFSDPDWAAFHRALDRPEPRTLRVRGGRISAGVLSDRLTEAGFRLSPVAELPGVLRVEAEPFPLSETLEHWLGLFYIQQAVTTLAAPALDPRPGEGILDLCAAPGGKTAHLAELMEDRGCVVAAELSEPRARALVGNLSRLAHPVGIPILSDALALPESASFHRVLADVPCSGEGRSRRDGPVVASEGDLRRLPVLQEALLRKALRLAAPGGHVLYVTCTLAPEENEAVVDRVVREPREGPGGSPPVRIVPLTLPVPSAPGLVSFEGARFLPDMEGTLRIHPHHLDSGGLYLALLQRSDGGGATPPPVLPGWVPLAREPGLEALVAEALEGLGSMGEEPAGESRVAGGRRLATGDLGWLGRGEAARFHRIGHAPLAAWEAAGDRPRILAVGLRGFERDRKGRLLPSGDLLRWMEGELSAKGVGWPLDRMTWLRLLDGATVEAPSGAAKQGVLAYRGHALAPARVRGGRVFHDLPPGRARWLRQVLARSPSRPL